MKIIINALSAMRGGGQTYIINILKNINTSDLNIILIVNKYNKVNFAYLESNNINIYEAKKASKNILFRIIWELLYLPEFLKANKADIYFAPGGIMITKMPKGIKSVTMLRNILPFENTERKRFPTYSYIRFKLWLLRFIFLISYKMSDKVIFISEYSKSIIEQYIPNIEKKSTVIPHGLNKEFLDTKLTYSLPETIANTPFYLYVSILDVYKAQKEIIFEWETLTKQNFPYPLVLVGPKYNEYGEEVITLLNKLKLNNKVFYLGTVPYNELPGLYKSAHALIFASSCECCPNILLEKLAAAKPTFCSNIQPMPEFGSDAVIYFDPYKPNDLAEKILELETKPQLIDVLSKKAYQQALKFDWKTTTQKTVSFLFN